MLSDPMPPLALLLAGSMVGLALAVDALLLTLGVQRQARRVFYWTTVALGVLSAIIVTLLESPPSSSWPYL